MGACFVEPKSSKAKEKERKAYERMGQPSKKQQNKTPNKKEAPPPPPPPSPFRPITQEQLIMQYSVQQLLNSATTLEGPKVLMHRASGGLKILRTILKTSNISQERVLAYKTLTGSESYQLGDMFLLLITEFYTGPNILEYLVEHVGQDCTQQLKQISDIIQAIHNLGFSHGGLSFDSFRIKGGASTDIGLADFTMSEKSDNQAFGNLHKGTPSADWQFFGVLVNVAVAGNIPYFSKQSLMYKNVSPAAEQFLLGKKNTAALTGLKVHAGVQKVLNAYQLRSHIFSMLSLRGKRKRYESKYFYDKQTNTQINWSRPLQEQRLRIEKARLSTKLSKVLATILPESQQDYVSIPIGGPKLNEFAYVMRMPVQKRLEQINYKMSNTLS